MLSGSSWINFVQLQILMAYYTLTVYECVFFLKFGRYHFEVGYVAKMTVTNKGYRDYVGISKANL